MDSKGLVEIGRDLEKTVLARAVKLHIRHRVCPMVLERWCSLKSPHSRSLSARTQSSHSPLLCTSASPYCRIVLAEMNMNTNRQWLLAKRPNGLVTRENFDYAENPIPEPGEGQVLVRNLFLSLTPPNGLDGRSSQLPASCWYSRTHARWLRWSSNRISTP